MLKIEIRPSSGRGGKLRWRTVHPENGEVGVWSEGYHNREDVEASIARHKRELASAEIEDLS